LISLLSRLFIKNHGQVSDPAVRRAYGVLCSVTGIVLNIILFAFKYAVGAASGAIAIMADAFNNLSDAGSSVITLIGFRLSGAAPDKDHPFGHGRVEYITGLIVSFIIFLMGFELGKSSVAKILSPEPVETSVAAFIIVAAAVLVKLYMFVYNRAIGKKINSPAMQATAFDSISDTVSTLVVLVAMLISKFTGANIDGWCGALVALFILYTGFTAARDTISPLLGQPPSEEFVSEIASIVLSYDCIVGIHDLVVHDYGPGRIMISLHAEVPSDGDLRVMHDAVDTAERELREKLGCEAVIHMDPIAVNDDEVTHMRMSVAALVKKLDPEITIHDFRMVTGPTHTNLIFDIVVPPRFHLSNSDVIRETERLVSETHPQCFCVITVDTSYI